MTESPTGGVTVVRHSTVIAGQEEAFAAWRGRLLARLGSHPGFLGVDTHPPDATQDDWVTVEHFTDIGAATAWLESPGRAELLAEVGNFLTGVESVTIIVESDRPTSDVTAVITNEVKPGKEKEFGEWMERIQTIQATYPGYRGVEVQQPIPGVNPAWVTLLRFDTAENLRNWLNSADCQRLTEESSEWMERSEARVTRVSFNNWLPADEQAMQPPEWKVNMVVLLVLYPVVMLTLVFFDKLFPNMGMGPLTFINNIIGVALTGFILIPWAAGRLKTWLSPPPDKEPRTTIVGTLLMLLGYAVSIVVMSAIAARFL